MKYHLRCSLRIGLAFFQTNNFLINKLQFSKYLESECETSINFRIVDPWWLILIKRSNEILQAESGRSIVKVNGPQGLNWMIKATASRGMN